MIQRHTAYFWRVQLLDNQSHAGGGAAEPLFFKTCKG